MDEIIQAALINARSTGVMKVIGYKKATLHNSLENIVKFLFLFLLALSFMRLRVFPWKTIRLNMKVQLFRFLKAIKRKGLSRQRRVSSSSITTCLTLKPLAVLFSWQAGQSNREIPRDYLHLPIQAQRFYDGLERAGRSIAL